MNIFKKAIQSTLRWAISTDGTTSGGNFVPWIGGRESAAGPQINEASALTIPAFFAALRLYGQTLGMLDWDLIQIRDDGRYIARDHPVHRLLHDEPSEFQTAASFRETIIGHAISHGNGYAYIERNGNFRPTALIPLMPSATYPRRIAGRLEYVTSVNGSQQILEPYQVFHVCGFGGNGLTGYPLVQLMRDSLGLTKAETEFASAFFRNGCNFGGTVSTDGVLSDKAFNNLKQSMAEQYSGLGGAFKWLFLEEGLKAQQFGVEPEKAQLLEARQFSITELSRITGLPGHLLGDLSKASFASVEQLGIEAVTYAFRPWANKLCQEANRKLLYESEKDRFVSQIDTKPLMAGDSKTQAEIDQIHFNCAAITPNQIAGKNGRNPIEGGDQLFVNQATLPLNIAVQRAIAQAVAAHAAAGQEPPEALTSAIGQAAEKNTNEDEPTPDPTKSGEIKDPDGQPGPAANPAEVQDFDSYRSILQPVAAAVATRLMRREVKTVKAALKKHDAESLTSWIAEHEAESRARVAEDIEPIIASIEAATRSAIDRRFIVEQFIDRTSADLRALQSSPDRAAELPLMLEGWKGRADEITNELLGGKEDEQI